MFISILMVHSSTFLGRNQVGLQTGNMASRFASFRAYMRAAFCDPKSKEFKNVGLYFGFPAAVAVYEYDHSSRYSKHDEADALHHVISGVTAPWFGVYQPLLTAVMQHFFIPHVWRPYYQYRSAKIHDDDDD